MSLQDSAFCDDAEEDVKQFLTSETRKRVLVFPPVNNYRRFLVHQLVQDHYGDSLQTFSIGQGSARRIVVCYKSDFIRPPQVNGVSPQASGAVTGKSFWTMGIESQCTPTASPEHGAQKPRQIKSAPTVEIYRPPAARRARLEKSPAGPQPTEQTTSDTSARTNRQKRPDRAVYVPRHRRSAAEPEASNVPAAEAQSKPPRESARASARPVIDRTASERATLKETAVAPTESMEVQSSPEKTPAIAVDTSDPKQFDVQAAFADTPMTLECNTERADERVAQAEKTEAMSTTTEVAEDATAMDVTTDTESSTSESQDKVCEKQPEEPPVCLDESDKRDRRKSPSIGDSENGGVTMEIASSNNEPESSDSNVTVKSVAAPSSPRRISDEPPRSKKRDSKVVKQALVSPVLIISTKEDEMEAKTTKAAVPVTPVAPMTPPEKKVKKVERPKSKPAPPPLPPSKLNRDECDWDSLFDDNGDCLDPTLMEELTSAVGEVMIEKPKNTYKAYNRPIEISGDEYAHVLEIYNFPSEFKSSDLVAVFSPFKSEGFELKWVDDTHCLGIFSSPLIAAEVLASDHPFVKTRPLSEATALSKTKARRSCEFLQPYRPRPETCAALARRLVTKSLGVTLATARQEREQEKIVLREAKEKKRLANKQREDVWEGIIAPKPTS